MVTGRSAAYLALTIRPLACGPGVPERATCSAGDIFRTGAVCVFVRDSVSVASAVGALGGITCSGCCASSGG